MSPNERLSERERRVLAALDVDGLIEAARDLLAIPSLGGRETPAQERVAEMMASAGFEVDVWRIDFAELAKHPAWSAEIDRDHGLGVVGAMGGGGGRSLILNGHVDVVPAGDEANWTHPPFRGTRVGERLYGRGAADMKGGLCCALFAARALRDAGVCLGGRLLVESVVGEEDGGCGTLAALERGYRADGAVVMEPTELAVVPAGAGAMNFRLTVPGRSAHACVREEGLSAIERFFPIHRALAVHEREKNNAARHPLFSRYRLPFPLSIGTLRAGDWPSSVPELLVCEGRYGVAPGEDLDAARRRFEAVVEAAAREGPWAGEPAPRVEWWGGQFAPAETPLSEPIVATVEEAFADVTGSPCRVEGATYGSDMRLLVNEGGIPTVLFGPGDVRRAHRPDEYVPVADLVTAARTLAIVTLRFCGGEP